MKRSLNFYVRKSHRYLGIFIGIQFLLWAAGGFYFSWMNIKAIRGEDLVSPRAGVLSIPANMVSPAQAIGTLRERLGSIVVDKIEVNEVLGQLYYEIAATGPDYKKSRTFLIDALTGLPRENISQGEAEQIARASINAPSEQTGIELLADDAVGPHSEYRGKPLPAWAVAFRGSREFIVYISAESGRIETVRTRNWRIYDFLWMLHTMDYNGRDNVNNYVLRAFSILGLITIASGFILFAISSPYLRRRRRAHR